MKEQLYKKQNSEPSNPPTSNNVGIEQTHAVHRGPLMSPFEIIGQQMDVIRNSLNIVDDQIEFLSPSALNSETAKEDNYDPDEVSESKIDREPTDFPGRGNYED